MTLRVDRRAPGVYEIHIDLKWATILRSPTDENSLFVTSLNLDDGTNPVVRVAFITRWINEGSGRLHRESVA